MDFFSTKIAYAADVNTFVANVSTQIINPLIKVLFALAVIFFLYGVFEFLINQENDEKRTSGKKHMIWGVIGIAIMMGVFTIMGMIIQTLGIQDDVTVTPGGDTEVHLTP